MHGCSVQRELNFSRDLNVTVTHNSRCIDTLLTNTTGVWVIEDVLYTIFLVRRKIRDGENPNFQNRPTLRLWIFDRHGHRYGCAYIERVARTANCHAATRSVAAPGREVLPRKGIWFVTDFGEFCVQDKPAGQLHVSHTSEHTRLKKKWNSKLNNSTTE